MQINSQFVSPQLSSAHLRAHHGLEMRQSKEKWGTKAKLSILLQSGYLARLSEGLMSGLQFRFCNEFGISESARTNKTHHVFLASCAQNRYTKRDTSSVEVSGTVLYCQWTHLSSVVEPHYSCYIAGRMISCIIQPGVYWDVQHESRVNQTSALSPAWHICSPLGLDSASFLHLHPSQTPGQTALRKAVCGIPRNQLHPPGCVEMSQLSASEVVYLERCGQLAHASVYWKITPRRQTIPWNKLLHLQQERSVIRWAIGEHGCHDNCDEWQYSRQWIQAAGGRGGGASRLGRAGSCPAWAGPAVAERCGTHYLGDSTAGRRQVDRWTYGGMSQ